MLPDLLTQTSPWHHVIAFTIFGFILMMIVKEFIRTIIVFVIISIFAESLQIFLPFNFVFELMDIVWNFLGCMMGMSLAVLATVLCEGHKPAREKGLFHGNDT